jgi:hypothetical protein
MRIFRPGAGLSGPEKTGFGIERTVRAWVKARPAFGYVCEDSIETSKSRPGDSQKVHPAQGIHARERMPRERIPGKRVIDSGIPSFLLPVCPFIQCNWGQFPEETVPNLHWVRIGLEVTTEAGIH